MTTNNPPIAAWAPGAALAKLASRHNNAPCVLTDGPAEFNDVALVRLSDYERLQADHERLQAKCEYYKSALLEATARSVSDSWKRVSTDKKLDQYLSAGIAQIEEERDRYKAERDLLCAAIRRLCNIYVVDDYYMGKQREEMLDRAVNRAIEQVQENTP